ncbi:hypothetical protein COEREDRAFT_89034 [Coemansia reversa NRRL 1564]|uniref:Uncharacterized protein n=1 Tax=Coemansia reversa (strain ATCC 12441 / NRRL 1564) TaxID=763665 RepID=A0A2G5B514_COERN|nr:hypothetical protein COEREDRAFT_89034 [Coemansia reversa NRRL 1564]|eukprot:PIA14082.1 hypothetical protein COEREDRAFT_89034 [Coemansia reversa NRRL 1564]
MTGFLDIPYDIHLLILDHAFDMCMESLNDWKECLVFLRINRAQRNIGVPKLYKYAIIEYPGRELVEFAHTNINLIFANKYDAMVHNFVLHVDSSYTVKWHFDIYYTMLIRDLKNMITLNFLRHGRLTYNFGSPLAQIAVAVELLLSGFPNMRLMFFRPTHPPFELTTSSLVTYSIEMAIENLQIRSKVAIGSNILEIQRLPTDILIESVAVTRYLSLGYFSWLQRITYDYDHLRQVARQINFTNNEVYGARRYILHYPNIYIYAPDGYVAWYDLYHILENDNMDSKNTLER